MVSSSAFIHERSYLDSLPEDLRVQISSSVGASSLSSIRNLRTVSKSFRRTCDNDYVIQRLSLQDIPLLPWYHDPKRFFNFFKRCRKSGKPEALYRKGLIKYFVYNRKERGLELLAETAEKGNKGANYVYGMILICSGDESIQKGFKILSSLIQPLMSNTMKELEELRCKIRKDLSWCGELVMKELKQTYVPEKCKCDGKTLIFLLKDWHGEDNDMDSSSACKFCLWNHEVELLFDKIE